MRVGNGENSRYTLFDLITNKEKDNHVPDMKPFIFNADLVDPIDVARRDYMEFFIENVISYRGNLKRKTELEFQIKWLGYDETLNSWEPYANLRDSDQLHVFLRQNNLLRLIPKKFREEAAHRQQFSIHCGFSSVFTLTAYTAKGFWKFSVSKSLTSLFCMSHVHAHNSQLRMQTCFAVDFLSNLLASHKILYLCV